MFKKHIQIVRVTIRALLLVSLLYLLPPPLIGSLVNSAIPTPLTRPAATLAEALVSVMPQPKIAEAAPVNAPNAQAGIVEGTVFRDYNANGTQDSDEPGIEGIVVNAADELGNSVGPVTTSSDGTYILPFLAGSEARVEFTLPTSGNMSFLKPGAAGNGTTVQFVDLLGSNHDNVNVGFNNPGQFTQDDPFLATSCYIEGPQTDNSADVIVAFPYDAGCVDAALDGTCDDGGSFSSPTPSHVADPTQIGTTYGLAYQRSTSTLFAATFMKRHTGFRVNGKTGSIYKIVDPTSASPTITEYVDFDALGIDTGTDPHPADTATVDDWKRDSSSWDAVGKLGFGDLEISEDDQTLWTVNLHDRKLYKFPIQDTALTLGDIDSYTIPNHCGNTTDFRPFATAFHDEKVYVGVTCTGESSASSYAGGQILAPSYVGDRSLLEARVYSFDPQTSTFDTTPELVVDLDYARQSAIASSYRPSPGEWNPWVPTFVAYDRDRTSTSCVFDRLYPQPWLTDIEFDNGNMILGIRDRFGDQTGYEQKAPAGFNVNNVSVCSFEGLFNGTGIGDTLRACGNPENGWTIESAGQCGGITSAGATNSDGIGGGEYYYQDDYDNFFHNDVGLGGLVQVPGKPDVVSTMFDPIDTSSTFYDGGIFWLNNNTGARSRGYLLYDTAASPGDDSSNGTFAKANGFGDMEAFYDVAPIEIGNRVWWDDNGNGNVDVATDMNGVQDPGEPAIDGLTVKLYLDGPTQTAQGSNRAGDETLLATTTTANGGRYYFSYEGDASKDDANGFSNQDWSDAVLAGQPTAIQPNTDYVIVIEDWATAVSSWASGSSDAGNYSGTIYLSASLNDATTNGTSRDTNFYDNPGDAIAPLTTAASGNNDHTIDAAFGPEATATLTVTKVVVNDDGIGSSEVSDFTLTVDGGVGTVTSGAANTVAPGSYTVSESGPGGYTATFSGDCDSSGSVTIAAGEDLSCTITNDDIPVAAVELEKTLISPATGLARVGDTLTFQLRVINTGSITVTVLNLADTYDPSILDYITASTTPDSQVAGFITWTGDSGAGTGSLLPNLPLAPGASFIITIDLVGKVPTTP